MTIYTLKWHSLLLVQVGGAICLPMLMIGFFLGQSLSLVQALLTIFLGNGILAILACHMSRIAITTRKTTPELAQASFGRRAGLAFSFIFMINLLGWFGIHLVAMADLIAARFPQYPLIKSIALVMLGLIITFSVLGGLRRLEVIAHYCLPLLLWGMLSLSKGDVYIQSWQKSLSISLDLHALFIVISGLFGCIVDLPTYFCRAQSVKDGVITSLLLFLVIVPFIEILGLGMSSQASDNFAQHAMATSSGWTRDLFLGFCIFAGWTTNNCNLFSAQTFLQAMFSETTMNFKSRVIITGLLGTLLAFLTIKIPFESLLISITLPLFLCGALLMALNSRSRI